MAHRRPVADSSDRRQHLRGQLIRRIGRRATLADEHGPDEERDRDDEQDAPRKWFRRKEEVVAGDCAKEANGVAEKVGEFLNPNNV